MRVDAVTDTLIIFSWDAPRDFGSDVEVYEVCQAPKRDRLESLIPSGTWIKVTAIGRD